MAGSERLMKALRPFNTVLACSAWNWIGFALSATIVAISVYVLTRLLHDIDVARVAADLHAMSAGNIAAAVFFVACAYGTLTCYDLFARRTIDYWTAALASFTSYAIGHNIGATAFSRGAIRYRVYSQFGLVVIEVAKICLLTGLTFWLGNLAVLGSGMIYLADVPSHILRLPPRTIQAIGGSALILLAAYVGWPWYRPRSFGRKGWYVPLPGGLSTLVQIGIGIAIARSISPAAMPR
jgi:uncharacterized membrane protein YbhN (UPF0104 family)